MSQVQRSPEQDTPCESQDREDCAVCNVETPKWQIIWNLVCLVKVFTPPYTSRQNASAELSYPLHIYNMALIHSSLLSVTRTYMNTQYCLCYWSCWAGTTPWGTGITGHSRGWGHLRHSGTIQAWWLFNVSLSASLILEHFTISYCLHQPQVKSKHRKWTF